MLLLVLFSILRLRHLFTLGRSRYKVVRHQQFGSDVWLVALRPLGKAITIDHGQYVYLQWSLFGEEHPFTVLQRLNDTGELTVAYKTVGSWTEKLAKLNEGDELFVDGPYGEFMADVTLDVPQPTVYIAAGIGVTPFVDPILTGLQTDSWLFYANKYQESATFSGQLRAQLGNRFVSILSRENTPAVPNDERGHISVDIIRRYLPEPSRYHYYICGSEGFMGAAEKVLHSAGVPSHNIHAEAFGW
jgi:predicted ferric reductase